MVVHPADTKKLIVLLNKQHSYELRYNRKVPLLCLSRQSRDLIVMSVRCLAVHNYLVAVTSVQEVQMQDS